MALTEFTKDVAVIQKLGTFPNADDGLTAEDLKKKFDEAPEAIKEYLNSQVVPTLRKLLTDVVAANAFWVTITPDETGKNVADKSYEEIAAARTDGRTVFCWANPWVMPLVAVNDSSVLFQCEANNLYNAASVQKGGGVTFINGSFARSGEVQQGFHVSIIQRGDGSWVSEDHYDDIRRAYELGRPMVCLAELTHTEQAWLKLPLIKMGNGGVFYFSAVCEGSEWLVTLSRNPEDDSAVVTVAVNAHPVTGTTLRDQVTGEIFTLYMDDADLHIVPGGKPTGARDQILLVDRTTGDKYTISVSNGVPMLESEV